MALSDYKLLEYIDCASGTYFNTLYKAKANDTIIFDGIVKVDSGLGYNVLFGYAQNNAYATNSWTVFTRFGSENKLCLSRTGVEEGKSNMIYNQRITFTMYQKTATWTNGTTTYSASCGGTANDTTGYMGLLVKNTVNGGEGFSPEGLYCPATIYSFKILNPSKEVVREMIPAQRKSDNKLGLYDKVNGTFYTNLGNGSITPGPDIFDGSQLKYNLTEIKNELNSQLGQMQQVFSEFLDTYTELNYIESTGTQYIDLGIKDNGKLQIEIKAASTNFSAGGSLFGYYAGGSGSSSGILDFSNFPQTSNDRYELYWNYPDSNNILILKNPNTYSNIIYKFENSLVSVRDFNNNIITSKSKSIYTPPAVASNYNLYLFARHLGYGTGVQYGCFRVYYCKIWDNGTLIRDMIPVKRSTDNTCGMLDKISKTFYPNLGTAEFVAGPVKIDGYKVLEYIQSNGTQYINTKYVPNIDTQFEIKVNTTQNNQGWDCILVSTNGDMGSRAVGLRLYYNQANYDIHYGTRSESTSVTPVSSNKSFNTNYTINVKNNTFTFKEDNTTYTGQTKTMDIPNLPLYMFAGNQDNVMWRPYYGKIYYCKIYNKNIMVRDYIPVKRISDNAIGMYDMVSKTFYGNSGTGTFIAGGEL